MNNKTLEQIHSIDAIGKFNYLLTIIFGNTMPVDEVLINHIEWEKEEKISGDFIFSVGKRAIILTKLMEGKRIPIIVKKVSQIPHKELQFFHPDDEGNKYKGYRDENGNQWIVSKQTVWLSEYITGELGSNLSISMMFTPPQ